MCKKLLRNASPIEMPEFILNQIDMKAFIINI